MNPRSSRRYYPAEPQLRRADVGLWRRVGWEEVDRIASHVIGRPCFGIPSVRVGICWTLEHLGLHRYQDHVLVPKFLGRCILNTLNRHALPVEEPTNHTAVAVVVDQFGLKQDLEAVGAECAKRGWVYIEDSPYGLGHVESLGVRSLARIIGLTKILPVVQGGLFISEDEKLSQYILQRRKEYSHWSWITWGIMALLRSRPSSTRSSTIAEIGYELYPASRGGNRLLRSNLATCLEDVQKWATLCRQRLDLILQNVENRILSPDLRRLIYVVPFIAGDQIEEASRIFEQAGFDGARYHVESGGNPLNPEYIEALLIPLNPRIPIGAFETLLHDLKSLGDVRQSGLSIPSHNSPESVDHHANKQSIS